jgi:cation transport ATPase
VARHCSPALASDDTRHVATVARLSRRTIRIVRQNYGIALGVNAGGLMIGALVFSTRCWPPLFTT